MNFRFSAFPLLFFALISRFAFSQVTTTNGFIVSSSGDSIPGKLEYVNANLSAKRLFIPAGTTELQTITPETVTSFKINDEVNFKTLPFKGKKVFMQVVAEGKLNLYRYKGELYTSMPNDSLIQLTGGKKTVTKDGKKYAIVDYTYKKQLRRALNTNAFDNKLNNLQFDKEHISNLAREINGQQQVDRKPTLNNKHQFEISLSYTRNAVTLKNIEYGADSIFTSETFLEQAEIEFLPAEKQNQAGVALGLFYKRKIGRKHSFLKSGLVYNYVPEKQQTQTHIFYDGIGFSNDGVSPSGYKGKAIDTYTYNLSTIEIPVSYFAELSDGKLRPFIDLGLITKFYSMSSVTLNREVYDSEKFLRTEHHAMKLPAFTVGPMISFGYKFLLSENHALLAGINANATTSFEHHLSHNMPRNSNLNVFVSYGF